MQPTLGHHTQLHGKRSNRISDLKNGRRIGSFWLNTLWYIHQYCWNHASKATDSLAVLFLVRQIVPLLLNSSVNAVGGGDKKWSDPHMESVEVISITLAFISAGWLKMIRVPELKLILRDWLSITRVWHNQCKWSHTPVLSNPTHPIGGSLIKDYLSLFKIRITAVCKRPYTLCLGRCSALCFLFPTLWKVRIQTQDVICSYFLTRTVFVWFLKSLKCGII